MHFYIIYINSRYLLPKQKKETYYFFFFSSSSSSPSIMAETEIPQYFICPISLEIMKDPVTAITGITYDRPSIEQWLLTARDSKCPVTKQPLPKNSDLTPNHTLRRLIQAWSSLNDVARIPTPKSPISTVHLQKLLSHLEIPRFSQTSLKKLDSLVSESERNRILMRESGVPKAMVSFINKRFLERSEDSIEESLRILRLLTSSNDENHEMMKSLVGKDSNFIKSMTWVLQIQSQKKMNLVNEAIPVLKSAIEATDSSILANLKEEFFREITGVIKNRATISNQAIKSALKILIETCPLGRNRTKIIESNAIFELIELELEKPEKNVTECVFNILSLLCSCADGRETFVRHATGIAVTAKRILRVSHATDDRAVHLLSLLAKYSASNDVVLEMLRVGAVSKLCMVMQADCDVSLKEKARGILRLHSKIWNNSPCIQVYLLTRHQR